MFLGRLATCVALCTAGLFLADGAPASAQLSEPRVDPQVGAVIDALAVEDIVAIMRAEALDYGADIRDSMFPNRSAAEWSATLDRLYDVDRLAASVRDGLETALEGADTAAIAAFLTSEPGASYIQLEVTARRAMLDPEVEEAAREMAAIALADETPRIALIRDFIAANDLIEINVASSMTGNFQFYRGLTEGALDAAPMSEEQILAEVWAGEEETRTFISEWLYAILNLAYQPMSDADLQTYIDFSRTTAGRQLNAALMQAYGAPFDEISRALGRAAARMMAGDDL